MLEGRGLIPQQKRKTIKMRLNYSSNRQLEEMEVTDTATANQSIAETLESLGTPTQPISQGTPIQIYGQAR